MNSASQKRTENEIHPTELDIAYPRVHWPTRDEGIPHPLRSLPSHLGHNRFMASRTDAASEREAALQCPLPDEQVIGETVQLLKGFADATRLRILCLLQGGEAGVREIVASLDVTQSAVSHQLRLLREARLVTSRKEGRRVYYRLTDEHIRMMLENALSHGEEGCSGERRANVE